MKHWAPLPLRLTAGIVFAVKGWWVLFGELSQRTALFADAGVISPFLLALVFGTLEFMGGSLLLLGVYVRATSAVLLLIEIIAIVPAQMEKGFLVGSAFHLLLIGGLVSLLLSGAGRFALRK